MADDIPISASAGIIYEISDETGLRYYGSTVRSLESRIADHMQKTDAWLKSRGRGRMPSTACPILAGGNFKTRVVESGISKNDLVRRERWWCLNHTCVNRYIPGTRVLLSAGRAPH